MLASVTVPFFNSLELVKESSEVSDFHTHKYCSFGLRHVSSRRVFVSDYSILSHFAGGCVSSLTWVGSTTQNTRGEALSL